MNACCSSGTFLARRSLISLCVASVLGAAAFVGGGSEGTGKGTRAIEPGLLFPAGTVMTISFDGKPIQENGKDLAISAILNEPEVKEFLKEALDLVNEQVDNTGAAFLKQLGLEQKDIEALAGARFAIGITRFEFGESLEDEPSFDLMLAAEMRGGQKPVETLLKALEAAMGGEEQGAIKETTVGGVPAKTMALPKAAPFSGVTWLIQDGWLIAGSSTKQLEAALARAKSGDQAGSALSDPVYAASMKEVSRPKTVASLFLNYGHVLGLVANAMPPMKEIIEAAGLESIKGLAYGMDLDGPSVRERMYLGIAPGAPISKLWAPLDTAGLLSRVPKRSIAAYAASLDLKGYADYLIGMFEKMPGGREEVEQVLAEIARVLGPGWRQDLLPNLGPEVGAFAAMPKFGFLPEIGILLKVGDKTKVDAAIAKIFESKKGVLRTSKFLDNTITTVDLGAMKIDKDLNLRPAYAYVGDYLLVTPSPHTMKSLLVAMNNKDGGLAAQETFSKAMGRLKAESPNAGNLGVVYLDFAWVAGFLLENFVPIAQSAVREKDLAQFEREVGFRPDLAKIPSTDAIVKHLGPILVASQSKEGGVYADAVSPTGLMGTFMAAGASVALVGVRQHDSIEVGEPTERGDRAKPRRRAIPPSAPGHAPESRPGKDRDEDK